MKENTFYNILPNELYITNDLDLISEYLIENNICQRFISKSIAGKFEKTDTLGEWSSKGQLYETNKLLIYSNKATKELYTFLLSHYKAGVGKHITFNLEFHQDTFGLNYDESKKIALAYFDLYYNEIPINASFKLKFDKNRNIIPAARFESLDRYKKSIFLNLERKSELIIPYLAGDEKFYNRQLFENNSMIKEIFEFENNLKILIELNDKYQFENDDIFTPKTISKQILDEYGNLFHSIKQIEFIEKQLENKSNCYHGFVVSLFLFFKDELQIKRPSARIFREIIIEYFEFEFGEIKLSNPNSIKNKERIEKLEEDWNKS